MRGTRAILAAIALAAMTGQTMAATYLCVEDASTGFNWKDGRWVQTNFYEHQNIVRKHSLSDDIAVRCFNTLARSGRSTEPVVDLYVETVKSGFGCYSQARIGEEVDDMSVTPCQETYFEDKLRSVRCEEGLFTKFKFEPAGEFILTRNYSAPITPVDPTRDRDSLLMAVGKCSVISP